MSFEQRTIFFLMWISSVMKMLYFCILQMIFCFQIWCSDQRSLVELNPEKFYNDSNEVFVECSDRTAHDLLFHEENSNNDSVTIREMYFHFSCMGKLKTKLKKGRSYNKRLTPSFIFLNCNFLISHNNEGKCVLSLGDVKDKLQYLLETYFLFHSDYEISAVRIQRNGKRGISMGDVQQVVIDHKKKLDNTEVTSFLDKDTGDTIKCLEAEIVVIIKPLS